MTTKSAKKMPDSYTDMSVETAFPSVRYFQVHFEYMHEAIEDLKKQLNKANQQISALQQQLDVRSAALAQMGTVSYPADIKTPRANLRRS